MEKINESQKTLLKDLLIRDDYRIQNSMKIYNVNYNENTLFEQLMSIVQREEQARDNSDETYSIVSGSSGYKGRRPRMVSVPKSNFKLKMTNITIQNDKHILPRSESYSLLREQSQCIFSQRESPKTMKNLKRVSILPVSQSSESSPLDTHLIFRKRFNTEKSDQESSPGNKNEEQFNKILKIVPVL